LARERTDVEIKLTNLLRGGNVEVLDFVASSVSPSVGDALLCESSASDVSSAVTAADVKSSEYEASESRLLDLEDLRLVAGDLALDAGDRRLTEGEGSDDLRPDRELCQWTERTDDTDTSESLTACVVSESLGSELSVHVLMVVAERVVESYSSSGTSVDRPVIMGLGDRDLDLATSGSSTNRTRERLDLGVSDRGVSDSIERSGGTTGAGDTTRDELLPGAPTDSKSLSYCDTLDSVSTLPRRSSIDCRPKIELLPFADLALLPRSTVFLALGKSPRDRIRLALSTPVFVCDLVLAFSDCGTNESRSPRLTKHKHARTCRLINDKLTQA
jgi:hypothetical protein